MLTPTLIVASILLQSAATLQPLTDQRIRHAIEMGRAGPCVPCRNAVEPLAPPREFVADCSS